MCMQRALTPTDISTEFSSRCHPMHQRDDKGKAKFKEGCNGNCKIGVFECHTGSFVDSNIFSWHHLFTTWNPSLCLSVFIFSNKNSQSDYLWFSFCIQLRTRVTGSATTKTTTAAVTGTEAIAVGALLVYRTAANASASILITTGLNVSALRSMSIYWMAKPQLTNASYV